MAHLDDHSGPDHSGPDHSDPHAGDPDGGDPRASTPAAPPAGAPAAPPSGDPGAVPPLHSVGSGALDAVGGAAPAAEDGAATPPPRILLVVIDETKEMDVALDYACHRVNRAGGRIGLLHVIESSDFQHWIGVSQLMKEEARRDAEKRVNQYARRVNELTRTMPVLYMREGPRAEEILKLLAEDETISVLVLGAAAGGDNPGPLIRHLTTKGLTRLRTPIVIVPGHLTPAQIQEMG